MTDTTAIRRRPDGSIDVEFYIARGQLYRSELAHDTARKVTKQTGTTLVVLATLGLATLFRGGEV